MFLSGVIRAMPKRKHSFFQEVFTYKDLAAFGSGPTATNYQTLQGLEKEAFLGRKNQLDVCIFWTFVIKYRKYILQKKPSQTAIWALRTGQKNLQTPIRGRSHQLDDGHKNPKINILNYIYLVGQLTMSPHSLIYMSRRS